MQINAAIKSMLLFVPAHTHDSLGTGRSADPASWLQGYTLAETSTLETGLARDLFS
jgi:hypothetical protein